MDGAPSDTQTPPRRTAETIAAQLLPCAASFYAVVRSIRAFGEYNHNDHMYVAAASLFPQFALYREIAYAQAPLNVLVYAALEALVGPALLYVSAKFASVIFVLGAAALASMTAQRLAQRPYVFWVVFTLVLFNANVFSNMAQTSNYALPLFLFSFACFLYFGRETGRINALLIGLAIGLAASSKISFIAPAAAFALLFPISRKSRAFTFQYAIGCAIGLLPVFYYFIIDRADFLFLNFEFHILTNEFRGLSFTGSVTEMREGLANFLINAIPVWLVVVAAILLVRSDRRGMGKGNAVEAAIILAATVIAAIMPMTYFLPYWGPAALAFTMFAVPAAALAANHTPAFRTATLLGALVLSSLSSAVDLRMLARDGLDNYPPLLVMRAQADISKLVDDALRHHPGCVTEILSASAIPALGSGVPLSPGSAGGEFLFRIDGVLREKKPEFRKFSDVTHYMDPGTGLLTGYYGEREFEARMVAHAVSQGFVLAGTFKYPKAPLSLYLPPQCGA